ncbi:MAG: hypothetical protein JNM04_07360 [Chthonomonas sp.]|nr:hypothetical protein [Chthonomonas sp.]
MTQRSNSAGTGNKEIPPGVFIGVIVVLVLIIGGWFFLSGSASPAKVDLNKLDPRDLRDEDPIRRGQPGYRERTTDPAPR